MQNRSGWLPLPGLLVALAACGDGGQEPPPGPTDTIPPRVELLRPAPRDTGVAFNAVVSVTFSEPVNPATVAEASFYLRKNFTPEVVPGTYVYEDRTAGFVPLVPLDSLTAYVATLTRGVRDSAGNQLVADTAWEFQTRGGPVAAPGRGLRR